MTAAVMASPSPARAFDFDYRSPARVEGSPLPCRPGCTDKLEEVCAAAQSNVREWRKERSQIMNSLAQRGLQDILKEEDVVCDLQADLAAVEELTEAARCFHKEGAKLGEAMLQCMKASGERAEVVAQAKDILRSANEDYQKELEAEERRLAETKEASKEQQQSIDEFLQRYSRSLGLKISRVSAQTILLSFTRINKAEPKKEFSVVLGLSKEGYVASKCNPEVPELPRLLDRLNEDSTATAVPQFICGLRRAFSTQA
ncbi:unnamed protein product [Cladocopium goreaui]|uniref:Kinetochore protein SPC25 n=1 Tax=Cladocopium goreaui TaxID=2562237 RepID=A0A9P1DVU0_9DINO|nr:unnamed protein product [Cladocopium goreaui]